MVHTIFEGVQPISHDAKLALWCFNSNPMSIDLQHRAGIKTFVIDCENKGKEQRQANRDTEINFDTIEQLRLASRNSTAQFVCRINPYSNDTQFEAEAAIEGGASVILLPMVRACKEVEGLLKIISSRAKAAILIETAEAMDISSDLASFPLYSCYVGLNDLAISYGIDNIFYLLTTGSIDRVSDLMHASDILFGVAGVTVIDKGFPISSTLLLAEMSRINTDFSFLRRSFRRDIINRDIKLELKLIEQLWIEMRMRSSSQIASDKAAFDEIVHSIRL